jgi:hypothetical protein
MIIKSVSGAYPVGEVLAIRCIVAYGRRSPLYFDGGVALRGGARAG